jgi:hypothetical protein
VGGLLHVVVITALLANADWNDPGWLTLLVLVCLIPCAVLLGFLFVSGSFILKYVVRGARNRDAGIPCVACQGLAFPLEGTTNHYRCGLCHHHFEGPTHF